MTLGYSLEFSGARVAYGEFDQIWVPRTPRANRCGLILVHGSGAPQGFVDTVQQPASVKLAASLAAAGIPCIAGDFGGQAWGNDTVVSRIDAAWAVLQARFPLMRKDKVLLLGGSMGGAAVAHYSQENPSKVAGVVGLIPLWDLKSFYNFPGYAGSVQNEIAAAWNIQPGTPLPARGDILARASLAYGIPHLCGYSSVDNIVYPPWSTVYSDAVGGTRIVTDSTYGHSDAAIAGMPISTVGRFLLLNGA